MADIGKYDHLEPKDCRIVKVEWRDIIFNDAWNDDSPDLDTPDGVQLGYLLEDGPHDVVIAGGYNYTDEKWCTIHAFPKTPPEVIPVVQEAEPAVEDPADDADESATDDKDGWNSWCTQRP
jgi:hypothetical protein